MDPTIPNFPFFVQYKTSTSVNKGSWPSKAQKKSTSRNLRKKMLYFWKSRSNCSEETKKKLTNPLYIQTTVPIYILKVRQSNKHWKMDICCSRWLYKSKNDVEFSLKTNFFKNVFFTIFTIGRKFYIFCNWYSLYSSVKYENNRKKQKHLTYTIPRKMEDFLEDFFFMRQKVKISQTGPNNTKLSVLCAKEDVY